MPADLMTKEFLRDILSAKRGVAGAYPAITLLCDGRGYCGVCTCIK